MNPAFRCLLAATTAAFALLTPPARGALLTSGYETQLESWLGQGDLDFTNLFTKTTGSTTVDFHGAADGQGATFVLISISGRGAFGSFDLPSQIIGGYNPQSWNSNSGYHVTPNDVDRTAFLYNLSTSAIQRQNLTGLGQSQGQFQTYNDSIYGPSFGAGLDLHVGFGGGGPVANLDYGYAHNYSYGGTTNGDDIVSGGPNNGIYSYFDVLELEVYTFSPAQSSVPDTAGTLGLLGLSLLGLMAIRRRPR